jgi:nitrate/nitrite transport system permease protein
MSTSDIVEPIPVTRVAAPHFLQSWYREAVRGFMTYVLPPLVIIGFLVLIWQVLGSRPAPPCPRRARWCRTRGS